MFCKHITDKGLQGVDFLKILDRINRIYRIGIDRDGLEGSEG
jgi:hypothetical protein